MDCKLEYSRQWAMRGMHEASLYEDNSYITLTFDDEHLPNDESLDKRTWQLFAKRLRKEVSPKKFRFIMCGEYGDARNRPHYHAILFGLDFPDKELYKVERGFNYYNSPTLSFCWPFGHAVIANVTFETVAYVARYVTKKITGDMADEHYQRVDALTGEISHVLPEFFLTSRGGRSGERGIGYRWWEEFKSDLKKDFITVNGVKCRPPKYYDSLLKQTDEGALCKLKKTRVKKAVSMKHNTTLERLSARAQITKSKLKQLPRNLT